MGVEATAFAGVIFLGQYMPSEEVWLAFFAFATIVFQGWQTMKVNQVHRIVNSQRTVMEAVIKKYETELARLAAGGAPTPPTIMIAPVTVLDGIVSTDPKVPPIP